METVKKAELSKSNEPAKPARPPVMNLFPSPAQCSYFPCYCEENVWKLCQDVNHRHPNELAKCSVVFVSNERRTVLLWRQRAGKDEEKLVIWDYHVLFLYHPDDRCLVYDLDTELPFPTYFHKYVTETFRTDQILKPDYFRYFRVVPAPVYLQNLASDRRHMKRSDGTWIKPPPSYNCIKTPSKFVAFINEAKNFKSGLQLKNGKNCNCKCTSGAREKRDNKKSFLNNRNGEDRRKQYVECKTCTHNLEDFISVDPSKGFGEVLNLTQFVKKFYKQ